MGSIYLTPASISYLNQFLLALVITAYLGFRLIKKAHLRSSTTDWLLTLFFVTVTVFSLSLFLEASLLPTERLSVVYLLNTILALMLVTLIQFAYSFPKPSPKHRIERGPALLVSLGYLAWEAKIAIERFALLREAEVTFRPPNLDYAPVALFAWVAFVFARGTVQNWRDSATRRFALIFLIPLTLALLNRLQSAQIVSAPLYHISTSFGILLTIFLFVLNYLASQPETTSLMVKFSGTMLTAVLAFFGVVAWLVTPAYAAQYRPPLLDHRSIRFTPNSLGGYDIVEIPFHFASEKGEKLALANEDNSLADHQEVSFDFPFYGQHFSRIFISNNGFLTFGEPPSYANLEYRFSRIPSFLALTLDLDPDSNPQGGVYLEAEKDRLIVTYDRLRSFYYPKREYTFQVVLYDDGRIDLTLNGLPAGPQYQVNDRPNASIWLIGANPGLDTGQRVSFADLPLTTGPNGALEDHYLAFRQYIHAFLVPLAVAILLSNLAFLFALPPLMLIGIARPLQSLLAGVEQFDRDQQHRHIPIQFHDEIGFLTNAFNKMSSALDDLLRNLETRVANRTAELESANLELRKLSVAVEQNPSVIIITNPKAEIEYVNAAFTLSTGYTFEEVRGRNPRFLQSGRTPPETFRDMWATLLASKTWRGELINRRKNGEIYWEFTVIAPIYDMEGNVSHYMAIKEDITARKAAEEKLEQLAITDPLTGLLNRRGFFQEAEKIYTRSMRPPYSLGVLMVDIDHFKEVNDRYGHLAGDLVLQEVATCIRQNLRPTDVIARYGGEEFVVLLPRTSLETMTQIAHRLNHAIREQPIEYKQGNLRVTISVGGVMLSAASRSLDELVTQADRAMYQAKAQGRDCCVIYRP